MSNKNELHQKAWHLFEEESGHAATSAREVVEWAVQRGLIPMPKIDPLDVLAGQMARALREEYATDPITGLRYRVNHAVRVSKGAVQMTLWSTLDRASRKHMEGAFYQRREQIVGDCVQLRTDVDVFNARNAGEAPIQLVLDFTDDVAERMEPLDGEEAAEAA
jgi:hypothetical protein